MTKGNAFIFGPKSLIPDDADYKIVLFSLNLQTKNKYEILFQDQKLTSSAL